MNADGTGVTRLAASDYRDYYTAWSPDGTKIAFVSHRDDCHPGNNAIYVTDVPWQSSPWITVMATSVGVATPAELKRLPAGRDFHGKADRAPRAARRRAGKARRGANSSAIGLRSNAERSLGSVICILDMT